MELYTQSDTKNTICTVNELLRDGDDRVDWLPSTRWARTANKNNEVLEVCNAEDQLANALLQEKLNIQKLEFDRRQFLQGNHFRKSKYRINESKHNVAQAHNETEKAYQNLIQTYKEHQVSDPDQPQSAPEELARQLRQIIQNRLSPPSVQAEKDEYKYFINKIARDHTTLHEQLENGMRPRSHMPSYKWANGENGAIPPIDQITKVNEAERELVKAIDAQEWRELERPIANEKRVRAAIQDLASLYQHLKIAPDGETAKKYAQDAKDTAQRRFDEDRILSQKYKDNLIK